MNIELRAVATLLRISIVLAEFGGDPENACLAISEILQEWGDLDRLYDALMDLRVTLKEE